MKVFVIVPPLETRILFERRAVSGAGITVSIKIGWEE
jgi:hypothetical protein